MLAIGVEGDLRLGARARLQGSGAQAGAIVADTVPLGKAAARSGAENFDLHEVGLGSWDASLRQSAWVEQVAWTQNSPPLVSTETKGGLYGRD